MSEHLSLNGAIVRYRDEYWLIEVATDLEMAWSAIIHAAVSGSVGATITEGEWDKPPAKEARVHRLTSLSYTPLGVYGAKMDSIDWKHPVLNR
jgi:hypothetical protein